MRVLHASQYFAPAFVYGGPPRSIHALCRALRARGVDVEVFTTDADGKGALPAEIVASHEYDGVPVRYFPRSWPAEPIGSRALTRALRSALPAADVLHIHGLWNRVVWAAAREARRAGVPYVLSPRGMLEEGALAHRGLRKRVAWTLFDRQAIDGASVLHATSDREAETLRALRPGADIVMVPNGVDLPSWGPASLGAEAASAAKAAAGSGIGSEIDDAPIIAFVGRLHPIKRLDLLVDAFARLLAGGHRARLVIAGPDERGLRGSLEALAGPAAGAITFAGQVDEAGKQAILARANALVLCSDSESFGLSVAEAMGAGVPVVVTRTCPWADVERHRTGLWIDQDAGAIANALASLLDDPAAARAMGERGRALVREKYRWDAVAAAMERLYRRLTVPGRVAAVEAVSP